MKDNQTSITYSLRRIRLGALSGRQGGHYSARTLPTSTYGIDDLCADIADKTEKGEAWVRMYEEARQEAIVSALKAGRRVSVGGVMIAPAVIGSFDTVDGEYDAARNKLVVKCHTFGKLRDCLSDSVPVNSEKGASPTISVVREADAEEERLITGRNISITGREIVIREGADDEGVTLRNIKTGEVVATASIVSSNLVGIVCSFESLPAKGRYLLVVATRGGFGLDYKVRVASREITVE